MENGTLINLPFIENEDEFWNIIRIFQNGILAGNDLFISTPKSTINQSKNLIILKIIKTKFWLDNGSSLSSDLFNHNIKRKSIEFDSGKYLKKKLSQKILFFI